MILICAGSINAQEITDSNKEELRKQYGLFYMKYDSYKTVDGEIFKIGDKIKLGTPSSNKTFAYISAGGTWTPAQSANAMYSNTESEIKYFYIWGTKKIGYKVAFGLKSGISELKVTDIEMAIKTGELISQILSSDKALELLKKAKDKLDLNIIDQVEYDSIRLFLIKYIK